MYDRKECIIEECKTLGRNKGFIGGKKVYGKKCDFHHKKKQGNTTYHAHIRDRMSNLVCSVCGWDKDVCDRHRINNEVGYTKENVVILCPNCHRLVTNGKLIL